MHCASHRFLSLAGLTEREWISSSKEAVVLRQWESETKIGFYQTS